MRETIDVTVDVRYAAEDVATKTAVFASVQFEGRFLVLRIPISNQLIGRIQSKKKAGESVQVSSSFFQMSNDDQRVNDLCWSLLESKA